MKEQLIRYTVILSIGTILSGFFVFLFRMIAARELSLEEYGVLALIISIYANIAIFSHFDIHRTLSHLFSKYNIERKSDMPLLYYSALISVLPTTIIALIIFFLVLFHYNVLTVGIALVSIVMFLLHNIYQHNIGVLNGLRRFKEISLTTIIIGLSRFSIIFVLFYLLNIKTFYAAFYAFSVSLILPSFISFKWSLKDIKKKSFQVRVEIIKKIYSFSFFIVLSDLARTGVLLLPRLILSFQNMASVALFDMALVLYGMFNLILANIPASLVPLVTERYLNTGKAPKIPLLRFSLISLLFLLCSYALFYFKADALFVKMILGEKFLPSLPVLHVIFMSLPFFTYTLMINGTLLGMTKVKELAMINILSLAIALPLFWFLREYHLLGLAVAFVIITVIQAIISHIVLSQCSTKV